MDLNIEAPTIDESAPSNVLHVRLPDGGSAGTGYWKRQAGRMTARSASLEDFNTDPGYPAAQCGDSIRKLKYDAGGTYPRQSDHAFVSRHFTTRSCGSVIQTGSHFFASSAGRSVGPAALLVEVFPSDAMLH